MTSFRHKFIDPIALPITGLLVVGLLIVSIGSIFLGVHEPGIKDRIDRPELWAGMGILLGVIGVMAFLASRPADSGFLGKDVAIGANGIWDGALPPVDPRAKYGEPGSLKDISEGYTVYAASGALAVVNGVLPAGVDYGRRFSGMIYAQGIKSAAKEMWIPFEAVTAVYPEGKAAFLAIQGDEAESLGWTAPPQGMTRGANKHLSAADKVK
ncbi:MAG: hypothetical protein KC435_09685 [Thermomicrobiales bacterium]|nr:hypothetical protein [Thermomicrobiales bacterium]